MSQPFNAHFNADHFFFTDPTQEARLVLEKQPIISPLTPYGLIRIRGTNAANFLQGQFSCDLNAITPTMSSFGAYCNIKGRVQSFFLLFMQGNDYLIALPSVILPATMAELQKYGVFSKVTIDDVSNDFAIFGLSCQKNSAFFDALRARFPSLIATEKNSTASTTTIPTNTQNDNGIILIEPIASTDLFFALLIVDKAQADTMWKTLSTLPATPVGNHAWQVVLIENGIPTIDDNTMDQFLPHPLNLPELNAVHFKKGCYRGQEIVARMHYKGKIKKHLYRIRFSGNALPQNGALLFTQEHKEAGQIVNAVMISAAEGIGLAIVDDTLVEQNVGLYTEDRTVMVSGIKN